MLFVIYIYIINYKPSKVSKMPCVCIYIYIEREKYIPSGYLTQMEHGPFKKVMYDDIPIFQKYDCP